jgi:hypothetical protein
MTDASPRYSEFASHYDTTRGLGLTQEQQRDLIEYLKSL